MGNLWDKRSNESAKAFEAFVNYRDMGPARTITGVYRKMRSNPEAKKPSGQFTEWAAKFEWDSRAGAYDSHLAAVRQKAQEQRALEEEQEWSRRRKAIRETGWVRGEALIKKADSLLLIPHVQQKKDVVVESRTVKLEGGITETIPVIVNRTIIEPSRWSLGDAARIIQTGVDLQRLAAGLSTDHLSADLLTQEGIPGSGEMSPAEVDDRILELVQRALSRQQAAAITREELPEEALEERLPDDSPAAATGNEFLGHLLAPDEPLPE